MCIKEALKQLAEANAYRGAIVFPEQEPIKPITINIQSIIGTLVIDGNDVDTDMITAKVEKAVNEVVESAREHLTDCQMNVQSPTTEDNETSWSIYSSGAMQKTLPSGCPEHEQTDNGEQCKKQQEHSAETMQYKGLQPKSDKDGHPLPHEATDCTLCPLYRNAYLTRHFATLQRLFHLSDK